MGIRHRGIAMIIRCATVAQAMIGVLDVAARRASLPLLCRDDSFSPEQYRSVPSMRIERP